MTSGPAFTLSKAPRDQSGNFNPGPGSYELPSKMVEKPGKTIGLPREIKLCDFPGPGTHTYDKPKHKNVSFSMGKILIDFD